MKRMFCNSVCIVLVLTSFDSISISFGNREKNIMCSGLPGIVQSSIVRSCKISTPFLFNIREASRKNVGISCK